MYKIYITS